MGISIGNEVNTQNAVLNNLYSSVKGMTSQFLNTGTNDFADYLNKNFDSIDKDTDNSISKAEIDLGIKRDQPKALDGDLKKLTDLMSEMFVKEVGKVTVTEKLTKSPAALNVEDGQMSIHLERLMRNHQQQTSFASTRILEINPYHPLIIKLSEMTTDDTNKAEIADVARLILDQAKIAEGEAVSDPAFFALKFSEYILKGM